MITFLLLVLALVCFVLAAAGWPPRIAIGWVGAALITITLLIAAYPGP